MIELIEYAQSGNLTAIKKILKIPGILVNHQDTTGYTALMYMALNGNSVGLKALIDKGAIVDIGDNEGVTALLHAVHHNKEDCLILLLDNKANPNALDHAF